MPDRIHAALIGRAFGGRIVGAIAPDATEIEAREKPVQDEPNGGKDDPPPPENPSPPRKRGRPRKDEQRPKPEPTRIERQVTQTLGQMLADLRTACDVGCKNNSKGYKETWTGYKLHIDVTTANSGLLHADLGLRPRQPGRHPADDHDQRPHLLSLRCHRLAYDAAPIHDRSRRWPRAHRRSQLPRRSRSQGRWSREVEHMKLIHMPDFDDVI